MNTAFQIIFQIISGILTIIGICQKKKWKMCAIFSFNNLIVAGMYVFFGRYTSAFVAGVAMLRTLVFAIYAYKNIKPKLFWLIIFELAFIGVTILTWQDAYDLILMFSFLFMCYGSWQDRELVLRICYTIGYTLASLYKGIIGIYISMGVEIACLITTVYCLVVHCILKKQAKQKIILEEKPENIEKDN